MPRVLALPSGPAAGLAGTRWIDKTPACAGAPTEWFFPAHTDRAAYAKGKECCAACPVRSRCLDYAMANEEPDEPWPGLWGGTTPTERRGIHKLNNRRSDRETASTGTSTMRQSA